jgi:Tol biopolymer transport system component
MVAIAAFAIAVGGAPAAIRAPDTLAFVSTLTSTLTLTTNGVVQRPLPKARGVTGFRWSPDGRRIAFVSAGALHVMNADGSAVRRLRVKPLFGDFAWSPDARRIALSAAGGGSVQLKVVQIDGGTPEVLTSAVPGAILPSWSPRSSSIAFTSAHTSFDHIYTVRQDGSGLRRLTHGREESFPSWSPNGRWLLYQPYICPAGKCGYAISIMRPDGSGKRLLAHVPGAPGGGGLHASWAPDSGRIAFLALGSHGIGSAVLAVDVTGKRVQTLARDSRSGSPPAWSPDGRRIAYATTRSTITVMKANGGEKRTFVQEGAAPSWRPAP